VENIIDERAIICICWRWEGQKKVHSLNWDDGDDRQMLEEFQPILLLADEVVAHNGDNFDIRWFNGRHLLHGLEPIPIAKTVDTLKIAKRRFYLNSYRLDYLAKKLLSRGKIHTGFDLWKDCIERTQPDPEIRERSVRKMVRYCKRDVAILEEVWKQVSAYDPPASHAAVALSGNLRDRWKCPHCGAGDVVTNKTRATAKGMVQHQMKCKECHRYYTIANAVHRYYREDCDHAK
jgi:DNA polymerase elongation subunit (family B)